MDEDLKATLKDEHRLEVAALKKKQPKLIEKKEVYQNPFIQVFNLKLQNANGSLVDYVHFQRPNDGAGITVIPIMEDGTIALIREYRPGADQWLLSFPMGGVERGESFLKSAKRELQEEAGLKAERYMALDNAYSNPPLSETKTSFVLALDCRNAEQGCEHEPGEWISKPQFYTLKELRRLLHQGQIKCPGTLAALAQFLDAVRFTELDSRQLSLTNGAFLSGIVDQTFGLNEINPYSQDNQPDKAKAWQQGVEQSVIIKQTIIKQESA